MLLVLDNFDSFTHNLLDYFGSLQVPYRLYRNDSSAEEIIKSGTYSGLVISPGPETPAKAGCLPEVLTHYINKVPVLGICLGHQAIGEYFGARLCKAAQPMHGKVSTIYQSGHSIFEGLTSELSVVRYHSLILKDLPAALQPIAQTSSGEVMAIAHRYLPVVGLQFHPEAWLTEHGKQMLINWYQLATGLSHSSEQQVARTQQVVF